MFKFLASFKGTVSPDITFYFRFGKIKSVLFVRPLMAFNFCYFLVLKICKYVYILKLLS